MNVSYVLSNGSAQVGEFRPAMLTGTGPASYNVATGDPISNPGANEYINFASDCTTVSGNYRLAADPISAGVGNIRAGAPSPSQSGWVWRWYTSGIGAVSVTQNVAGSGMTPGTTVPIVFTGGTGGGAAGTLTVLTATTVSITITSTGSYTVAPTAAVSGTGGTPPTLTVAIATTIAQVASGTNLSAEVVQFAALVSQL